MQFVFDLPNDHPIHRISGRVLNMITDRPSGRKQIVRREPLEDVPGVGESGEWQVASDEWQVVSGE